MAEYDSNPSHPHEAVKPEKEVESELIAEAKLRHENAESEWATPQEKKQAAVERAHALSTRPDGSYAQLHETDEPTLAVADEGAVKAMKEQQDEAREKLQGNAPATSERGRRDAEQAAQARNAEREAAAKPSRAEAKQK